VGVFLYILIFIGTAILIVYVRIRLREFKQKREFRKIFDNKEFESPKLKIGFSHGWETFTVTFSKPEDYDHAEKNGLFDKFKNRIKLFYDSTFDPERAIYFTYEGK